MSKRSASSSGAAAPAGTGLHGDGPGVGRREFALMALGALAAGCVSDQRAEDRPQTVVPQPRSVEASAPPAAVPTPAAAPAPPPPPVVSFDVAIANVTHAVFSSAPAAEASAATVVIDPLIDGVTGYQSKATQSIQDRIAGIIKSDFAQYRVQRITPESLKQQPRFLAGTFTPIDAQMKPAGQREAYWFCLVMGDLKTGKIIAKSVARVRLTDADATPTAVFGDSPVWTRDPSTDAYVANCQGNKVGDPIRPEYFDGLLAAALVSEADDAYNDGRYAEAFDLYTTARKTAAGDQLRVYNGLYLSLTKLGRTDRAAGAFRDLIDYGLRKQRLAVKFLFRPGSVRFASDAKFSGAYGMWIKQIASQVVASRVCLQITGHTSPTGPAGLNDSLSLLRAEYVQSQLEDDAPALIAHTVAAGAGSRENLIGTGRDDATDILDRRVELKPIQSCS